MEERILDYLSRRAAVPENLAVSLEATQEEVDTALAELQREGWISVGAAWYGDDPSSAITVITLSPSGREEAARREAEKESPEPIEISREELADELRGIGWSESQVAMNPTLRGSRYWFWPSIKAWSMIPDR